MRDAARAALDVARQAAGLALEVEAQDSACRWRNTSSAIAARPRAASTLANTNSRSSVNSVVDRRSSP